MSPPNLPSDLCYRRLFSWTEEDDHDSLGAVHLKSPRTPIPEILPEIINAYMASKLRQMAYNELAKAERARRRVPAIVDIANDYAAAYDKTAMSFKRGQNHTFHPDASAWVLTSPPPTPVVACRWGPLSAEARTQRLPAPPGLPEPSGKQHAPAYSTGGMPAYFPPPGLPHPPVLRQQPHTPESSFDIEKPAIDHAYGAVRVSVTVTPYGGLGLPTRLPREKRRALPTPPDAVSANDLPPLAARSVNVGGPSLYSSMQGLSIDEASKDWVVGADICGNASGEAELGDILRCASESYDVEAGEWSLPQLPGSYLSPTSDEVGSATPEDEVYITKNGYFPGEVNLVREGKLLMTSSSCGPAQHVTVDASVMCTTPNVRPGSRVESTGAPSRSIRLQKLDWSSGDPVFPGAFPTERELHKTTTAFGRTSSCWETERAGQDSWGSGEGSNFTVAELTGVITTANALGLRLIPRRSVGHWV